MQKIEIESQLCRLAGHVFYPENQNLNKCVMINSAMAVEQYLYFKYARFLASHGLTVITWDYSGFGQSKSNDQSISINSWVQDYENVVNYCRSQFPHYELLAVGHSLGGQIQGLVSNNGQIKASLNIASGVGYWGHFPFFHQIKMLFAWYLLFPSLVKIMGYLPGTLLGASQHIPKAAACQWRRWCLHPEYFCDEQNQPIKGNFQDQRKMLFVVFTDDHSLTTLNASRGLQKYYNQADIEEWLIEPKQYGVNQIGHFGFFSSKAPSALWAKTVDWLKAA